MGSIIAYDVLSENPDLKVAVFVTIGSPLAIPSVLKRSVAKVSNGEGIQAVVPEGVQRAWMNFSDLDDRIAMNYNLQDDCVSNSCGILPQDHIVVNDYIYKGVKNPHKSYGYLRSQEFAQVLSEFLSASRRGLFSRVAWYIKKIFSRGGE